MERGELRVRHRKESDLRDVEEVADVVVAEEVDDVVEVVVHVEVVEVVVLVASSIFGSMTNLVACLRSPGSTGKHSSRTIIVSAVSEPQPR